MAGDAKPSRTSKSGVGACTTGQQPLVLSNNDDDFPSTAAESKRKTVAGQESEISSTRKKLRSHKPAPSGKYSCEWDSVPNKPVWVHIYDGYGWRGWMPGIVEQVQYDVDGNYKIVVHVKNENGKDVVPYTIHDSNADPIPRVNPKDPAYQLRDYIIGREEGTEKLSIVSFKHWRCLKYYSNHPFDYNKIPEQDVIGKSLLDGDPDSPTSMRNLVHSLMVDENVKTTIKKATGEVKCSAQHALAYFIGQLCGIELSESADDDVDPKGLLNQIGSNDSIDCPTSQIFLLSAMSARTKKSKEFDPRGQLYDSRRMAVFSDPEKLKARMGRLKTALAAIHSSQRDIPPTSGPAFALLTHGIRLMIDMRGTSDHLLDKLAEEGICRPAKVLRVWIRTLAEAIDPLSQRSPPPDGKSYVVAWTADNADFHLFHRVVSVVPVGNVLLDLESRDDTEYFNEKYMPGLPDLSEIEAEHLASTAEDDAFAQEFIDAQNIHALLEAAKGYTWLTGSSASNRRETSDRPDDGTKVNFGYRSEVREGTIQSTTTKDATVEFTDGNRTKTIKIPLKNIEIISDTASATVTALNTSDKESQRFKHTSETFKGERHRFDPTTTQIVSVLTGLSSKNRETSRQIIDELIVKHGKVQFSKAVHTIVADQEFMPTMINEFFSRLKTDDELPILPCLAIGHTIKNLSTSMMSYYQCFFDPMLEAMGVKKDSPEYNRYYKGSVIRDSDAMVSNFTEMLAVAASHQYLQEVGNDRRVEAAGGEFASPVSIINTHLASLLSDQRYPGAHFVTAMDAHMRPIGVTVTDSLQSLARDFQRWAKDKWGTNKRNEVGPSGFERKSAEAEEQQDDPVQLNINQMIEADKERFETYRIMKYADDGEEIGLLNRCVNAGLLPKSSRRDKDTLAKKLYLYEVRHAKELAVKFGAARKVPTNTNSTGLAMYDILFGVERFAIMYGHYLTRVRPKDMKTEGEKWLVFFKALSVSTFMRWQPNYQRLALAFLIQLTLITKHKDSRCKELALKRIRLTFCVSEWGDSHKCYPVDLLQEHSLVEQTKKVGQRDPASYRSLEQRVQLHGYLRLHELESRASTPANFDVICPERLARAQEEEHNAQTVALVWTSILGAIINLEPGTDASANEQIQGFGDDESRLLFACRSRAYYRTLDAVDHRAVAGSAFLKGYRLGCEVAIPPPPYPILRCLHRDAPKKKTDAKASLASESKRAQQTARTSLTDDGFMRVPYSNSILAGLAKAGDGKSGIYKDVLSTMSHNLPFEGKPNQIGDYPCKPVVLTRTRAETSKHLMARADRNDEGLAPVHRYVDFAKDLYGNITRMNRGSKNSVNEFAKDIICHAIDKYYSPEVEMVCLTMDVQEYMTALRMIPHAKRGKMNAIKIPHGSLSKVRKGSDDLTPHGARSDLLACGDQRFTKLLFECVCNQARALANNNWSLTRDVSVVLMVIGGSPDACVAVGLGGRNRVRLNTNSIAFTCQEVEEEMEKREIVKSEEGEMMVYSAMATVFRMGFTHEHGNDGIDCIAVIHSDDSDAFAGMGMQFIYNLESTCLKRQNKTFLGAIYLNGPKKSVPQISKLGNIFTTNTEVDRELCPTGRGFEFMVDLVAVYYTLEQNSDLPKLPHGHRAITAVTVVYTLVNHDYLRMAPGGLTYRQVIAALKSQSYREDAEGVNEKTLSPVKLTQRAVLMDNNHDCNQGFNLRGILLLLHHAFINRPPTKKILLQKYKKDGKSKELQGGIGYHIVRAAAILAGEVQPIPDPISLLAHLSCANLIFRRWTMHPYNSRNRKIDQELEGSCYVENTVKGRKEMSIQYDLCDLADEKRQTSMSGDGLLRKLTTSYYGNLLHDIPSDIDSPIPFSPMNEINVTLECRGFYPPLKVLADSLPALPTATSDGRSNTSQPTDTTDGADLAIDAEESGDDIDELYHHLHDSDDDTSTTDSLSGDEGGEISEDEMED